MKKNIKRILITGSTGFLGRHLANHLIAKGKDQIILTAAHEDKKLGVHKLDLTEISDLSKFIVKVRPDVIIHTAALVNLSRDFNTGIRCFEINAIGTYNLLEALRNYPPKLFVFTSTEEVYGQGKIPYDENQVPDPPSPYAVSKIAAEQLCRLSAYELNFKLIIFRIGTMYGPFQKNRFIPNIIVNALNNKNIALNSGSKKRDYIYIKDAVEAITKVLSHKLTDKIKVINIGGGITYSLKDIVDRIIKKTESHSKIILGKLPDRIQEADEWLLDLRLAKKILNWQPKTSLDQGLMDTINFYRNNF